MVGVVGLMHRVRPRLNAQAQPSRIPAGHRMFLGTGFMLAVALFAPRVSLSEARADAVVAPTARMSPERPNLPMPRLAMLAFVEEHSPMFASGLPSIVVVSAAPSSSASPQLCEWTARALAVIDGRDAGLLPEQRRRVIICRTCGSTPGRARRREAPAP